MDHTTEQMVRSCVLELGVLSAEIQILKPTHLVFYTASLYPGLLSNLAVDGQKRWRDLKRETVKCGQKNLLWWDRET
ncbi:MAG TPA: hypothetical protein VFT30_06960, partial [Nitrospira sp.]|nr:hypothetical protein [Nitrospira sp.]